MLNWTIVDHDERDNPIWGAISALAWEDISGEYTLAPVIRGAVTVWKYTGCPELMEEGIEKTRWLSLSAAQEACQKADDEWKVYTKEPENLITV